MTTVAGRTRPTFFVIGAAKAGTSSLCHLLRQHPEVGFSAHKELHYFSFDECFARGDEWYESCFAGAAGKRVVGEGSTTYTLRKVFPQAPDRIAAYDGDLKLIYIVRHPFDRMRSVWMQLRRFGAESPFQRSGLADLPAAMRVDVRFERAVREQADVIVESTNYLRELEPYRQRFGDDAIQVVAFEDLQHDPRSVLRTCFAFLGVDPDVELPEESAHVNSSAEYLLPRRALWRLWSSPRSRAAYVGVARLFPRSARSFIGRHFLRVGVERPPSWDADTRAWALDRLRPELLEFCARYHLDPERWGLTPGRQ